MTLLKPSKEDVWAIAEHVAGHKIGEVVSLPSNAKVYGCRALAELPSIMLPFGRPILLERVRRGGLGAMCEQRIEDARRSEAEAGNDRSASEDIRTLAVAYGRNGSRSRTFRNSIQDLYECDFDDFPFEVRTALEYCSAVAKVSESCHGQHLQWVQTAGIPHGDRSVYEDDCLARILDLAIEFDGLNVANLACMECLVRRKQLIAEAHVSNAAAPRYEGADHFMEISYRPGGAIVVPKLSKFVANKMESESRILKEKRKLEDARGKGGKGRGKYKDTETPPGPSVGAKK